MIQLRNVERTYKTGAGVTYVLRRVNLDIREGEFLTLGEGPARERIARARARLEALGLVPVGFVPPAWLAREEGHRAVGGTGLSLPGSLWLWLTGIGLVAFVVYRTRRTGQRLNLRPLLSLSQADLHLRFRPSERWLDQNAMIKGMMGLIQNARQADGSYVFTFSGPLARLTPRPGR